MASFTQGLKDSGFIPGQNVFVELRYGAKDGRELSAFVTELVRLKAAVIVTV
jgi:hypothetical protein